MALGLIAVPAAVVLGQTPTPTPNGPAISYFAPVNADGCPFCCEFSCRLTPTPTPEFDGQGRRVYTRGDATFILNVEALSGAGAEGSVLVNATTGSRVLQPITHSSGRPSLQLLVNNNGIGNGSTQKCDIFPPNPGGVPGVNPPDFRPGTFVTDALIDMACRYDVLSSSQPCTRNRFGDFAFLGQGSFRQYCYSVPGSAQFSLGETIVAAQVRGTNGNLGPRQEIVIRIGAPPTGSPTPTRTATPTRTPTPGVNSVLGRVRYYSADRSVASASVQLSGPGFNQTTTSATGNYSFSGLVQGNWHVEPRKDGAVNGAISSLDAAFVFQSQVGSRVLSNEQRLAADVTGNGTVSSLDGARIVQYRLGSLARFQVADACNSDWAFIPMPGPAANQQQIAPAMTTGSCQHGAIELNPLVGMATGQDFFAVLFGDVTGNWQPAGALAAVNPAGRSRVQLGRLRRAGSRKLRLPVVVRGSGPFSALELQLAYDSSRLRALRVRRARAAQGAVVRWNKEVAGLITVVSASGRPMPRTAAPLFYVDFEALNGAARQARVQVLGATVDDVPALLERDH